MATIFDCEAGSSRMKSCHNSWCFNQPCGVYRGCSSIQFNLTKATNSPLDRQSYGRRSPVFDRLSLHPTMFIRWHWAGVRLQTQCVHFAESCVFIKQFSSSILCHSVQFIPCYCEFSLTESCFLRSHACILPSSFPGGSPMPVLSQLTHLCWFEYGLALRYTQLCATDRSLFHENSDKDAFLSFFQTMLLLPKVLCI